MGVDLLNSEMLITISRFEIFSFEFSVFTVFQNPFQAFHYKLNIGHLTFKIE